MESNGRTITANNHTLVARLRNWSHPVNTPQDAVCAQAADEIERLNALLTKAEQRADALMAALERLERLSRGLMPDDATSGS